MATQKRPHDTADPDYTDTGEVQAKKQRLIEQDGRLMNGILTCNFS